MDIDKNLSLMLLISMSKLDNHLFGCDDKDLVEVLKRLSCSITKFNQCISFSGRISSIFISTREERMSTPLCGPTSKGSIPLDAVWWRISQDKTPADLHDPIDQHCNANCACPQ